MWPANRDTRVLKPDKFELIERFKFFHELSWKRVSRGKRLLQKLARYRCNHDNYRWPVEMLFTRWLVPAQTIIARCIPAPSARGLALSRARVAAHATHRQSDGVGLQTHRQASLR